MAEISVDLPAEILLSKRVQEMVLNDEEPPAPYKSRDDDNTDDDDPTSVSPIPIIDLNPLVSSSEVPAEESQEVLERIKAALSSWGCFQAIGHGNSSSFLDELRQVTREFFAQPMEEKKKYAKTVVEFEGYGADPVPEEGQSLDWSDRLYLNVQPADQRNYKLWPGNPVLSGMF